MEVKGFSIRKKRGSFLITFFCFTPKGKEKIIKLYFKEFDLIAFLKKVEEKVKGEKEIRYIG